MGHGKKCGVQGIPCPRHRDISLSSMGRRSTNKTEMENFLRHSVTWGSSSSVALEHRSEMQYIFL